MSSSRKKSRLARRPGAVKRHKGDNSLHDDYKYAVVLPFSLSLFVVFALGIGLCFVFSKKHMEDTRGRVVAEESRKRELTATLQRETSAWEQMKSPQVLRLALLNNGVKMTISPKAAQRIAMGELPAETTGAAEPPGMRYAGR